jgi:hypothetical protein
MSKPRPASSRHLRSAICPAGVPSAVGPIEMLGATPPGPSPQLDEMNRVASKIPAHHSMTFDMERA